MSAETREELLGRCVQYHGHLCVGQALGLRLALKGLELIQPCGPREVIVFIENDRCIADAIQVVTGTRLGRRSAKLVNYGKMAASFINTTTGAAFRVSVQHTHPDITRSKESIDRVLHAPDAELLAWRKVRVPLSPEDLPGRPRRTAICARCGEKIFDGREVASEDGAVCISCARGSYYEVVENEG